MVSACMWIVILLGVLFLGIVSSVKKLKKKNEED